jgi:hypothetical protein
MLPKPNPQANAGQHSVNAHVNVIPPKTNHPHKSTRQSHERRPLRPTPPNSMNDNPAKPIRFAPLPQELPPAATEAPQARSRLACPSKHQANAPAGASPCPHTGPAQPQARERQGQLVLVV